ncbi:hypothetical protein KFE25_014025 [Diacronema lutheri]|uniref:ATP-dependent RNA helicase n=1 Tax=Diacronema lutheri TaxID=2081491 RepID=A0A8J6C8K9_DIALT|nr:hypothetical protein KFE25_014025 [Diacronema lutheri]
MTALQADVVARGRFGLDVLVHGPARSGKTVAAVVLAAEMLRDRNAAASPRLQALLLAPSRELALQTCGLLASILAAGRLSARCVSLVGGTPYAECVRAGAACDAACATPGRLCALLAHSDLDASATRLVILDEYDLLLDSRSFGAALPQLLHALPEHRQLVALATRPTAALARAMLALMRPPAMLVASARELDLSAHRGCADALTAGGKGVALVAAPRQDGAEGEQLGALDSRRVRHLYVLADGAAPALQPDADSPAPRPPVAARGARGRRALASIATARTRCTALLAALDAFPFRQAIVFSSAPDELELLEAAIGTRGWPVVTLSAAHEPAVRERALERMRDGRARVLVCTDVVSRGVDCGDVDVVVHAQLPPSAAALVNRVGRALAPSDVAAVSVVVLLAPEVRALGRLCVSAGSPEPEQLLAPGHSRAAPAREAAEREAVVYDDLFDTDDGES